MFHVIPDLDVRRNVEEDVVTRKEMGASRVFAACAHAVLTDPAVERIQKSVISELIITNTIPLPPEKQIDKIKVLSVAPLLGEAIMRIFHDVSVSRLFDK